MSGLAQVHREPDPDVLELLSSLLEKAQAGTLQGLAIVTVTASGAVSSAWAGAARNDRFRLLGALTLLQARIVEDCNRAPDSGEGGL